MMNSKQDFLTNDFIFHLKHLAPDAAGKWGIMNGQQMVEHFTDSIRVVNGQQKLPVLYEEAVLQKSREFLMSERPFRENMRNPLLPETPPAPRNDTMQASIAELQLELKDLLESFEKDPDLKTENPMFGELDQEGLIRLLYKHAKHHLRQFGLDQ